MLIGLNIVKTLLYINSNVCVYTKPPDFYNLITNIEMFEEKLLMN